MEIKVNIPPQSNGLVLESKTSEEHYQYLDIEFLLELNNIQFNTSYVIQDITHICFSCELSCRMSDGDIVGSWEYENSEEYTIHTGFEGWVESLKIITKDMK